MADDLSGTPSANPFDQIGGEDQATPALSSDVAAAPTPAPATNQNPFDAIGPATADASGMWGSFTRAFERGVAPAVGSLPAIGAGAEVGGAAGAAVGSVVPVVGTAAGGLVGGVIGGIGAGIGAGTAISAAQNWAVKQLPLSWQEAIGQDDRQQKLDEQQHPVASFLGGLTPYALTMRPGGWAKGAIPENSTALQRILANPATAHVFGGAVMGGMELGNEKVSGADVDWRKVAIATGFGLVFNKPTQLGESLENLGTNAVRSAFRIPEAAPIPGLVPPAVPEVPVPTVAQAGDTKVMGPGVTESVFHGTEEQDPQAAMTAQDTARTEQSILGQPPEADLHALARRIDPDTFQRYDELSQRRDAFRQWISEYNSPPPEDFSALEAKQQELQAQLDAHIESQNGYSSGQEARRLRAQIRDTQSQYKALQDRQQAFAEGRGVETPELATVRQHLQATDYEMRDLAPDVSAAYRRAADAAGHGFEPEATPIAETPSTAPAEAAPQEATPAAPAIETPGTPAPPPRPVEEQLAFIANDIAQKLVKAGRPVEEAEASGKLLASRYQARADRFGGALGTPEDLYRAEGPEIKQGKGGVAVAAAADQPKELAQAHNPQTETPEFKTWFGESKVKGEDGNPLTVYHGSTENIESFDPAKSRDGGLWFTSEPEYTSLYSSGEGGNVTPTYLSLKNPATVRNFAFNEESPSLLGRLGGAKPKRGKPFTPEERAAKIADLKAKGYDGIIDPAMDVYVAFEPEQVKSAIGNNGDFDPNSPKILEQTARGKIRIADGEKPIITLMKDANASTFIHETGHQWLEELMKDDTHEAAPADLKTDAATVRSWLGVDTAADIKTRQHEKFARGFEQYMREGVAPSPGLANVFAKFKNWLTTLYQTLKGLGKPINEDIRSVFDRMLSTEPQRTIYAPDRVAGPSLADIHEADAAETEPHEADAAMDRVNAEKDRYIAEQPAEILEELQSAIAAANPGTESGAVEDGRPEVGDGGTEPNAVATGGAGGAEHGALVAGSGEAGGKGAGVSGGPGGAEPAAVSGPEQRQQPRKAPGSELAPSPTTVFGPEESPLLDKAGNIRLDTLTTSEDVAKAIRDAADENQDFIGDRRGVVTDGQVMDLADALGMDYEKLQRRQIGQAFNAEQVMAARKLLVQSATEVSAAMKKAAAGTDEDVMAYALAKDRHQMIQAQVAGITAEAGRALRAFRNISGEEGAVATDQFIKQATGKTLFQLREEAKLGAQLDTPQKISKFMQDTQKRSFGRMVLEYWINGLISGPATHTTYMIGNTILALEKAGPETAAAAAIGAIRKMFGREGETVRVGEIAAQLKGITSGAFPAIKAAADAFQTGVTTLLPGESLRNLPPGAKTAFAEFAQGQKPSSLPFQPGSELVQPGIMDEAAKFSDALASTFGIVRGIRDGIVSGGALLAAGGVEGSSLIGLRYTPMGYTPDITVRGVGILPVGSAIRLPGRFIASIHSLFRSINYSMEKNARAYRAASNEGLSGNDFDARVADLRQNPTPEIMEGSRQEATQLTLMGHGSQLVQAMGKLTNTEVFGFPLLKFIDPFVHIAGNVIDQSIIQRSPVGILAPELRADLMGKNGSIAQDRAQARMLVGTALSIGFGSLASEGLISGSGPSDPKEAATWRLAGNQANSVKIGNIWYDVHRLGPMGMLMGIAADMFDVSHAASQGDMLQGASLLQHAFTQNILDESFMKGPADLIKAVEDPGRYGEAYIRNFLSSFVPYSVGSAQIARAMDPYSRQARTVMDSIKAKIPGMSETLYPRRDLWGEPMPNRDALLGKGLTAIYETAVSNDPVNKALLNLGISPSQIERKIRNVPLTDQQYDDFSRIAGRMTKMRLDSIVKSPDFQTWPDPIRRDVITEVVNQSREAARGVMLMKNPAIVTAATQARLAKINGTPAQ